MQDSLLDFFEHHSVRFLEMALHTSRRERLRHPDGYGKSTRSCGDTIEIFLTVRQGIIATAAFEVEGCLYSVACANAVVHMAEGKHFEEALAVTPQQIAGYLETLPQSEFHCAESAVKALRLALADVRQIARNPWKKFYPRP